MEEIFQYYQKYIKCRNNSKKSYYSSDQTVFIIFPNKVIKLYNK